MLTITVLVENISHRNDLIPSKALSLLLEDGDEKLLLDTGADAAFLKNAETLGIQLENIKQVALSHGHYDHAGGIPALMKVHEGQKERPILTCHPDCFIERYVGKRIKGAHPILLRKLDAGLEENKVRKHFIVQDSKEPQRIGTKFLFLGEISRSPEFLGGGAFGIAKHGTRFVDDYLRDDTAIVWKGAEGLVIITGCSHSGICNIIQKAQEVIGEKRIAGIVGGLHLRAAGIPHLFQIRNFFKNTGVARSHACHCTGSLGGLWLPNNVPVTTGDIIIFH